MIENLQLAICTNDVDLAEAINAAGIEGVKAMYRNPTMAFDSAKRVMNVIAIVSTTASLLQLGAWLIDHMKKIDPNKITITIDGEEVTKDTEKITVIIDKKIKKHQHKRKSVST